jgi:Leucine-rich repeat (LRR) protein
MAIDVISKLLTTVPRHGTLCEPGQRRGPAQSPPPTQLADVIIEPQPQPVAVKKNPALFYFGDRSNQGKTDISPDGIAVIKAKDEKYAFKDTTDTNMVTDVDVLEYTLIDGNLVKRELSSSDIAHRLANAGRLFRCTQLRLNNNELSHLEDFRKVVSRRFFRPFATLTVLDLSFNQLAAVPEELAALPLHTLLLHSNKIAAMAELRKLQPLSGSLRSLTLHDNPLQCIPGFKAEGRTSYRLSALTQLPFLTSLDTTHVTRQEQERVKTFVQVFLPPKQRKLLAPLPRRTVK